MDRAEEFKRLIEEATAGELPHADALLAFDIIMTGGATQAQIGAFLMALRMRTESFDDMAAAIAELAGMIHIGRVVMA